MGIIVMWITYGPVGPLLARVVPAFGTLSDVHAVDDVEEVLDDGHPPRGTLRKREENIYKKKV